MAFDRESGAPPQEKKPKPYPQNLTELSEEVFSLIYEINSFLRTSRLPNENVYKSISQAYKKIVREIFKLYKNPSAETLDIENWQEGLDILRNDRAEAEKIKAEKIMQVPELEIQSRDERQKIFFQRLNLFEARVKKINSRAGLLHVLKNLKRDFLRATTNKAPDRERGVWIALKSLKSLNDEDLRSIEKMFRDMRGEPDE